MGIAESLRGSIGAEARKLLTLPAIWIAITATTAGAAVIARALAVSPRFAGTDPSLLVRVVPDYVMVGFLVLGVLASTSEYASRQMSRTLTSTPRRLVLVAAKITATALIGLATASASVAVAWAFLGGQLTPDAVGLCGRIAAYLTIVALLSAAIGLVLRQLVATLATALVFLVLAPPLLRQFVDWARWLPTQAGSQMFADPSTCTMSAGLAATVALAWTVLAWTTATVRVVRSDA